MIRTRNLFAASIVAGLAITGQAQDEATPQQVLITNVHVFDGINAERIENARVLIEDNLIVAVSTDPISADGATVIDGGGRTLLPGFIENHAHLMLPGPTLPAMEANSTWEDLAIHGAKMAEMYLMQGFTTVRDAGGANGGLRRAIDAGTVIGPRYYPSGAFLSTRGGHADFANYTAPVGQTSNFGRLNMAQEVDSVGDMNKFARNNFRMGATQLKYMQSGGVVSAFDPWQLLAGSPEEIEAAVRVAEEYGSYVMAHSYRKKAILTALNAGVKSIEHGFMFDCEISALMAEKGAYITTNLTAFDPGLLDIPAVRDVPASLAKAISASAAFSGYIDNMKQCPAKRGYHTDCVGSIDACNIQIAYEKHLNNEFFGPHAALVAMTSVGGEIAALTGDFMNPYPNGKLGVIEPGAYADLLIVDGNPLEDFSVVGTGDKWFGADPRPESPETLRLIMKDGVVYKNTLDAVAAPKAAETINARITIDGRVAVYGVQFESGSDVIQPGSEDALGAIAAVMAELPDLRLAVVGHTDDQGDFESNMDLSERRAGAVVAALVGDYDVAADRLFAAGASFLAPIASNETEEGRALNRRVELVRAP